jgi:putative transposase
MSSNARSPSVGEGSDGAVRLAAVIVAQSAEQAIPYAVSCRALGVSAAFYKWRGGDVSVRRSRRHALAAMVAHLSEVHKGTFGSPRGSPRI